MGSRSSSLFPSNSHGNKRRHYSTLLLLALGAAMLSVLVLHKLREGRVVFLLLQERERQLLTLQLILEKERAHSKEMKSKIEELKSKALSLRTQKIHLNSRLMEAENLASYLKDKRQELESALREQQDQLSTLKGMEEASVKANLKVAALTDSLKQHQDHDDAPANATLVGEISSRNETGDSTRKEETAGNRVDDGDAQNNNGVKEVESSEQEQGSKGGGWVRFETNMDDDNSAGEEDQGMVEVSDEGKHLEEGTSQAGNQSAVEARDENQISKTELLLNSTVDGKVPVMRDEVTSSNTTENNVRASEDGQLEKRDTTDDGGEKQPTTDSNMRASEDGQLENKDTTGDSGEKQATTDSNVRASEDGPLEKKDNSDDGEKKDTSDDGEEKHTTVESNASASEDGQLEGKNTSDDGEEKQTRDSTETSVGRSLRRRTRGRRTGRAAARSWVRNTEASKDSQTGSSQHEESSKVGETPDENKVDNRNATKVSRAEVQPKLSGDQTASVEEEATERKTQSDTATERAEDTEQKTQTDTATEGAEVTEQKTETDTVSLESSAGSHGSDGDSEAKGTETYQDTTGIQEKGDSGDQQGTIRSNNESDMTEDARQDGGEVETRQQNNVRSTMEVNEETVASSEGSKTEDFHGGEEGEGTGKETEGDEQPRERDEEDDEEKEANATTDSIQQEVSATRVAEEGEVSEGSRLEQEPEAGNSAEEESLDEDKAEAAAGAKSERDEAGDANEDEEF